MGVSELEVKDPRLLVRYLNQLEVRISGLEKQLGDAMAELGKSRQADKALQQNIKQSVAGITVENRTGLLAQPQKPRARVFATAPTSADLQALSPDEIYIVTGAPNQIWRVVGGNPHTSSQIL